MKKSKRKDPTPKEAPFQHPVPAAALQRLEEASASDLEVARLTIGLFETIIGWNRQTLFPGYQPSMRDWREYPEKLRLDVRSLVDWAFISKDQDLYPIYSSSERIQLNVRQLRGNSPLGESFRRNAKRLMDLHPAPSKPNWGPSVATYNLMSEEIGKPLTERIVFLAAAIKLQILQIVPHNAYMNYTWAPGALTIRLKDDGYTVESISLALEVRDQKPDAAQFRFEGELNDYFETGTEGVIWMLDDETRYGRAALEPICEGDNLTILGPLGEILWEGTVRCDKKVGYRTYPMNPEYGQQCALGHWVHWIQEGFEPDDWARFFIRPDYDRLRGILIREAGSKKDPKLGPSGD